MHARLRVGVLGLGRRWRRYRPIVERLRRQLVVTAVCDARPRRAERQAQQLGCAVAAGPVELLDRDDVEALLLLAAPWYGLWPLECACRVGKPVFCAASPAHDGNHVDEQRRQVEEARLPVLMALPGVESPAILHLRELLAGSLGPAQLVRADRVLPVSVTATGSATDAAFLPMLRCCADLFGTAPIHCRMTAVAGTGLTTLTAEFCAGRAAQLTVWRGAQVKPSWQIEVVAEKGTAAAELPGRLRWRDAAGGHVLHVPGRRPEQSLLERFVQGLREGTPLHPGIAEAHEAWTWLQQARNGT
jgi:predicted dehydrogenase